MPWSYFFWYVLPFQQMDVNTLLSPLPNPCYRSKLVFNKQYQAATKFPIKLFPSCPTSNPLAVEQGIQMVPPNVTSYLRIIIIKCPPVAQCLLPSPPSTLLFSPPSNLAAVEQGIQLVPPDDGERISHVVFNDRYHEEFFIHKVSFRPKVGGSNRTKLIRVSPSDTQCIICLKYFKFDLLIHPVNLYTL